MSPQSGTDPTPWLEIFEPLPAAYQTLPLPGYQPLALIGQGGMGAVLLAQRQADRELVTIKVMTNAAGDRSVSKRLEREALTLRSLRHHNIVTCHDYLRHEDQSFVVMGFVPGRLSLRLARAHLGPCPESLALRFMSDTAAGLAHAHGQSVIHRDIKPDNLLIYYPRIEFPNTWNDLTQEPELRVMLVDFGLAKGAKAAGHISQVTADGLVMGSPPYMSPEQAMDEAIDYRSDLYALGASFYFLATGLVPFDSRSPLECLQRKLNTDMPPAIKANPALSKGFSHLLETLMARDASLRPASYESLAAQIADLQEQLARPPGLRGIFNRFMGRK